MRKALDVLALLAILSALWATCALHAPDVARPGTLDFRETNYPTAR